MWRNGEERTISSHRSSTSLEGEPIEKTFAGEKYTSSAPLSDGSACYRAVYPTLHESMKEGGEDYVGPWGRYVHRRGTPDFSDETNSPFINE